VVLKATDKARVSTRDTMVDVQGQDEQSGGMVVVSLGDCEIPNSASPNIGPQASNDGMQQALEVTTHAPHPSYTSFRCDTDPQLLHEGSARCT